MIISCPHCQTRVDASSKRAGDAISCRCGLDFYIPKLPNIAKSWHCPNCSASVDPSENRCKYCDAYLAFSRCPACFSVAPYEGAKHCAECGVKLILAVKSIQSSKRLDCPRCQSKLNNKIIDKNSVDYCRDCSGLWLSHSLLEELVKNVTLNITAILAKKPSIKKSHLVKHPVRYLHCPECDTSMYRRNFMSDSNVIVDECDTHGIWFDKHELAIALDYIRSKPDQRASNSSFNKIVSNRDIEEVFEIKDEDLSLLLQEFPHWVRSSNRELDQK